MVAAVVVVARVLLGALAGVLTARGQGEAGGGGDVDGGVGGLAAHGLVDRRLEAGEVDDGLARAIDPTALGVSSRSWGSTPGLVSEVTRTWSPPTRSAANWRG